MENIKLPDFFNKVTRKDIPKVLLDYHDNLLKDKFDFIKEGEFFWAEIIITGELSVFVKDGNGYFIAGNWEGDYKSYELNFIEIINKPNKNKHGKEI